MFFLSFNFQVQQVLLLKTTGVVMTNVFQKFGELRFFVAIIRRIALKFAFCLPVDVQCPVHFVQIVTVGFFTVTVTVTVTRVRLHEQEQVQEQQVGIEAIQSR